MEKRGWWKVDFTITIEGEEVRFRDLDELVREYICKQIAEGYREGEVFTHENITLTSEWDDGSIITTDVIEYDSETGSFRAEESDEEPEGNLIREYITLDDGTELDVCMNCHEYVLKTEMVDDETGKGIHEELRCPGCSK